MGDLIRFHPWQMKSASAKGRTRAVGRDLLIVLVAGLGLGAGAAWLHANPAKVTEFIATVSKDWKQSDFLTAGGGDGNCLASSDVSCEQTGDIQPGIHSGYFPVCSMSVATRENCVVDGDTFSLGGETIRIADIDAPETHPPRCAYEADLGDRATTRLSQLLSSGPFKLVRHGRDHDRYGRKLRVVTRDGGSIGDMLVAERLARPWTGKRRPWCPGTEDSFG